MYTRRIFLITVCTSLGGLIKRKPKGKATSFETKPKKYPISLCLYYVCCRPTLSIIYQFLLLMCHSNGKSPFHSLYFLSIQWQRKRFTRQRTFCLLFSAVATTSEYQEYLDSIIICSLFSSIAANGKIYTWHDDQKKNCRLILYTNVIFIFTCTQKKRTNIVWNDAAANKVKISKDLRVTPKIVLQM